MDAEMDFDFDWESTGQYELHFSPQRPRADTVQWLNSQPPPGLRQFMIKQLKPQGDRVLKPELTLPFNDFYDEEKTTTTSSSGPSRPLTRTNSRSRIRSQVKSGTNTASVTSSKDQNVFVSIIKEVSAQVDENVAQKVAEADRAKRKGRHTTLNARTGAKIRRTRSPMIARPSAQALPSISSKGERPLTPGPHSSGQSPSILFFSSSTSSANTSTTESDTSMMDIDIDFTHTTQTRTHQPDPVHPPQSHSTHHLTPTNEEGVAFHPATPAPITKLHPLLVQRLERRQQQHLHLSGPPETLPAPQPAPAAKPRSTLAPPPPPHRVPYPSQPSRLPALGMRRAHTLPTTAQQEHRRKVFKPPTLSQPQPRDQLPINTNMQQQQQQHEQQQRARPAPTAKHADPEAARKPSPEPGTEADSSFGDISFDIDALEETMRQYD